MYSVAHPLQQTFSTGLCLMLWKKIIYNGKVSIGDRTITHLRFADNIGALAEEEQELEALVKSLSKTCTKFKIEICAEKTKLMKNSAISNQREINVKRVTSFMWLGVIVVDEDSTLLSKIAQATTTLTKLKPGWRADNISFRLNETDILHCHIPISVSHGR